MTKQKQLLNSCQYHNDLFSQTYKTKFIDINNETKQEPQEPKA